MGDGNGDVGMRVVRGRRQPSSVYGGGICLYSGNIGLLERAVELVFEVARL